MKDCKPEWAGRLTHENFLSVIKRLYTLLKDKSYIVIISNQGDNFEPKSQINCHFTDDLIETIEIETIEKNNQIIGFMVNDNYNKWGYSTKLKKDTNPPGYETPYFKFWENRLIISHNLNGDGLSHRLIHVLGGISKKTEGKGEIVEDFIC